MKIAVCDDDMICRSQIISLLNEYIKQNPGRNIIVSEFANAENLLDAISKGCEFDAFILDVVMPGMNGIELGVELRRQGVKGKIIYLTSNDEFAIDSYKAKATNYI
ncbi:MAG: response regulator, partial [Clostridia bacterium]|nr:response regulator [Clostridia bacterium]